MKRLVFMLIIMVWIGGCEKEDVHLKAGLFGTWELRQSSGSLLGFTRHFPAGNGNTITFLDSAHFTSTYSDDNMISTGGGIYKLSEGSDCSGNEVVLLSYPPNEFQRAISISGDTLHIDDNCMSDGIYNTYYKIK